MPTILLAITTLQLISLALILVFLFLAFKLLETTWSYKISKPHAWEAGVRSGTISKELKKIERSYRDKVRFYNFWFQVERLKSENVQGAFAEVGVYKGETARMIHAMDASRIFYLFDTFAGFSDNDLAVEEENEDLKRLDFTDTKVDDVVKLIGGNVNIKVVPGYFPETTASLQEGNFALVHLDADLYQPTLEGLKYFYPRLSKGGIIIVHDYNHDWKGVKRAVDEFIKSIPEGLISVPDWQGSVMIVRNG